MGVCDNKRIKNNYESQLLNLSPPIIKPQISSSFQVKEHDEEFHKNEKGETLRQNELYKGHRQIPNKVIKNIEKSICKIICRNKSGHIFGTGFFMEYKQNYYLLTNYHVISESVEKIDIEIWDENRIELNLKNRYLLFLKKPKDITIIQVNHNEINNIKYLQYDLNYIRGYSQYQNTDILCMGYPFGNFLSSGSGQIKEINDFEFFHDISTDVGSSGSPILLFNGLIIGIHKEVDIYKSLNVGTFIGEIFKYIHFNNIDKIINIKIEDDKKKLKVNCI